MSKPVYGDINIDKKMDDLNSEICDAINVTSLRNIDIKIARKLAKTMKIAAAELDDYIIIRMEQKLGGHIGATKKKTKGLTDSGKKLTPDEFFKEFFGEIENEIKT